MWLLLQFRVYSFLMNIIESDTKSKCQLHRFSSMITIPSANQICSPNSRILSKARLKASTYLAPSSFRRYFRQQFATRMHAHVCACASRSKSRSKEAREPETCCHARRTIRDVCLSIELAGRWRWTIGISIRGISRLVRYRRIVRGEAGTCLCTWRRNWIEKRNRPGRLYIWVRTLISRFPRYHDAVSLLAVIGSPPICDYEIARYSARMNLPSSTVHTPLASIVAYPGFRPRHVFHSGAVCSPILHVNYPLGEFSR